MVDKLKISFRSTGKDDAPLYHVSGAHGGATPDGCVVMWAYMESAAIPDSQAGEVDERGQLVMQPKSAQNVTMDRRFQCGLVMTPVNAREISRWLDEQANKAEEAAQSVKEATVAKVAKGAGLKR